MLDTVWDDQVRKYQTFDKNIEEECFNMSEHNADGMTLREYEKECDRILNDALPGISLNDLGDIDIWNRWNDCVPPNEACAEALREEGAPDEIINMLE